MEKKKGCLGGIVIILLLILIIVAINSCGGDKEKETIAPPEGPAESTPPENKETDTAALVPIALGLLEENFEGIGIVSYREDEKSFCVTPTDPAFVAGAMEVMDGNAEVLESWTVMVESMVGLSKSISKTLPGHYLQIVNPVNDELSLLIVLDGLVIYNLADE